MERTQATALVPAQDALVRSAVGYARQEMVEQGVYGEPWHAAFSGSEERREMAEMGQSLFRQALSTLIDSIGRCFSRCLFLEVCPVIQRAPSCLDFRRVQVIAVDEPLHQWRHIHPLLLQSLFLRPVPTPDSVVPPH